ncbi:fasciclin domain-containing protein [Phenylobacterium sp.]|uniref:fasciclin domain-containing protein n=1 Tax=Phenylobacterium sp. TaxID=1871053 RepID=UPI0035B33CD0
MRPTTIALSLGAALAAVAVADQTPAAGLAAAQPEAANSAVTPAATPATATPPPTATATATATPSLEERPVVAKGDLVQTLRADGRFTTLVKGLEATNLVSLLKTTPNLTLFAPTDAAFAALPANELDRLMADKAALQSLLLHHLINARIDAAKIKGAKGPVPAVSGQAILLDGTSDTLAVGEATIRQADVAASNGVLHVVDQVLRPGAAPAAAAPTAS